MFVLFINKSKLCSLITPWRIIRRIFAPKGDENGDWRGPHNEELHSLYRSPNTVRVIKSRRLRWAGRVVRMRKARVLLKF